MIAMKCKRYQFFIFIFIVKFFSRSPDIDMQRNGTSTTFTVIMEDKSLADDISLFDELENRSLKNRSNDMKNICPDPEDNRKLSKLQEIIHFFSIYMNLLSMTTILY